MVVPEASINNIMGGLENTAGVRLHNHRRKLKQRFDIVRKLGQGTYGKVQLGINKETGQEVAIKTIKKCKIETEADLIRIRREIQIMSSVQHPNIIHIYEVFENREKMVLVMEYAAGGELYDYLSEKKVLAEDEARRLFRQIATAIYYCHKHKICHRDLKLENVLLDEHGSAKIADFGLSNVFDDCRLLGTFCGSPLYASPEIVKGTPYRGPEVDCWSLGVLLYTLVYGAMPFDGSNFKRLVRQISNGDYFEPKKPSPASPLIRDMLNVNPSRRADITAICSHWWVDEGNSQEPCLTVAEELANQTPVRLDLLLSLASSNDKLIAASQNQALGTEEGGISGMDSNERPLRSQSLGSIATGATKPLDFIPELPNAVKPEECRLDEMTERRKKDRSKIKKRDRSSSKNRKTDYREDSTSDASVSEVKSTRRSMKKKKSEAKNEPLQDVKSSYAEEITTESEIKDQEKEISDVGKSDVMLEVKSQKDIIKDVVVEKMDEVTKDGSAKLPIQEMLTKGDEVKVEELKVDDEDNKKTSDKNLARSATRTISPTKKSEETKPKATNEEVAKEEKKTMERRKSKIFETAEKFNNIQQQQEQTKPQPKKVFLPGVKVSDAKKAYERKSSLASSTSLIKSNSRRNSETEPGPEFDKKFSLASTVALNKLVEDVEKLSKEEDANFVDQEASNKKAAEENKRVSSSPSRKEVAKEDSISKPHPNDADKNENNVKRENAIKVLSNVIPDESKIKSATLPRRKLSRAEIKLVTPKLAKPEFRSEVEHMVAAAPSKPAFNQRAEVVFPIAAVTAPKPELPAIGKTQKQKPVATVRENSVPKEHIIPIRVEHDVVPQNKPQTVASQQSIVRTDSETRSLSRQSTVDSDSGSVTSQGEPIRKSPREFIIPIAVEGGGFVTPSEDRLNRMSSLNESEDDMCSRGFGLHSARRPKKPLETADSISSDEDDDNFEILTAENLFSTLLSRVRNLTHRLNTDENRSSFPRLFNHHSLFDNSPSRRLSEARSFNQRSDIPWRRSVSRDAGGLSSTLPRVGVRVTVHTPSTTTSSQQQHRQQQESNK